MEDRKSLRPSNVKSSTKSSLSIPKASRLSKPNLLSELKLNALKAKAFYQQLQKLRKTPKINKISRELIQCKTSKTLPKSSYVKKILSTHKIIKKDPNDSIEPLILTINSPRFASFSVNPEKTEKSSVSHRSTASDIYSRSTQLVQRKEKHLEEIRRLRKSEEIAECTFQPNTSRRSCSFSGSLSVKLQSANNSSIQNCSQDISYTSLCPTPRKFGFSGGCNFRKIREKSSPMLRYLELRMPLLKPSKSRTDQERIVSILIHLSPSLTSK